MKAGINTSDLILTSFIVLKLIGEIDWPWIWVLSPFWVGFIVNIVINLFKKDKEDKPRKNAWDERMEEMQNRSK